MGDLLIDNQIGTTVTAVELLNCLLLRVPKEAPKMIVMLSKNGGLEVMMEKVSACMRSRERMSDSNVVLELTLLAEVQFVQTAIYFMTTIAKSTSGAELLTSSRLSPGQGGGLAYHITDGSTSLFASLEFSAYTSKGVIRRNPWHVVWCTCLRVLATALRSIGHRNHCLEDVLDFVLALSPQLFSALTM